MLIAISGIEMVEGLTGGEARIHFKSGSTQVVEESYEAVLEALGRPTAEEVRIVRHELGLSMQSAVAVLMGCRHEVNYRLGVKT